MVLCLLQSADSEFAPRAQVYGLFVALQVFVYTVGWRFRAARRRARQVRAFLRGGPGHRRHERASRHIDDIAVSRPVSPPSERQHAVSPSSSSSVPLQGNAPSKISRDAYPPATPVVRPIPGKRPPAARGTFGRRERRRAASLTGPAGVPFWGSMEKREDDVKVDYFHALFSGLQGLNANKNSAVKGDGRAGTLLTQARYPYKAKTGGGGGGGAAEAQRRKRSFARARRKVSQKTSADEETDELTERTPMLSVSGDNMLPPDAAAGTVHEWVGTADNLLALVPDGQALSGE